MDQPQDILKQTEKKSESRFPLRELSAPSEMVIDPAEIRVALYAELGEIYDDWIQQTAIHFAF
jgi:hypothetical protein